ncbi:aromatic ring-hydroxylating dioxygenase subunit alpha [Nevskia sp.]|uniref:aromatic ring-hydroxylating dioxygenase subunit alpha n=1 Tax=Nevskia sp. TaxID=1929292 RepID=UPI0025CC2DE4|nr:aromatic ring-hydroxylating dioxygenase subunit alpha [Nevskia sp.]
MTTARYLNNAWYVAAWSNELSRSLLERTILEQPVLLYRKENGDAVAIGNACPHRHAPLHLGKLIGDAVQCPYHGLRFNGAGTCVLNPHGDGMIPTRMRTASYPVIERHNLIWLWFGEVDKADPATIPDFSCHKDPELAFVGGVIEMKAHYELITDNLLDLAHSEFVHEGLLSSAGYTASKLQTIEQGTTIYANRWAPNCDAMPAFHMIFDGHKEGDPVDHWAYMRWDAPAHMLLDVGIAHPGRPRGEGAWIYGTDILTPKDATTTYYFWGITRAYKQNDPAAGELWRQVIKGAFEGQDQVVIEAQQRMLGDRSFEEVDPVMFASDAAAQRARKLLARLREQQAVPRPENPVLSSLRQQHGQSRSPILPVV